MPECVHCKKTDEQITLRKCTICHKYYCDDDAHLMSGRAFCSPACANYFFFGDADD